MTAFLRRDNLQSENVNVTNNTWSYFLITNYTSESEHADAVTKWWGKVKGP